MKRTARILRNISFAVLLLGVCPYRPANADDWLPIAPEDLALKDNPKQAGADAMILYRQVDVEEQSSSVVNYERVKIFTHEGATKQAGVEIRYFSFNESVKDIRGRTIQPDGRVTEFDGQTLDREIVKVGGIKYLAKTFTMPDVQPGSIIEYKYREQFGTGVYWSHSWIVQSDLFTRLARFSVRTDMSRYRAALLARSYNLPAENAKVERPSKSEYVLEIRDLPGIEEEPLMPSRNSLTATVDFYYPELWTPDNETVDQFWKRIGKAWNDQADRFVDKKKELAAEVARDVSSGDSAETKLRKLYARVLKVRNLDMEDNKSKKETKQEHIKENYDAEDVLKHGSGSGLDITFLMIGLARAAGFEAAEIRVASKNKKLFYPERKATSDLTSALVWVRADSKEYFLDPAARYFAFGVLPWDEAATSGIRMTKDGCEMVSTPEPALPGSSTIRHADLTIAPSMEMSGKLQVDFTGLEGAYLRLDHRDDDAAGRKKLVEDEIKGWMPVGATFEVSRVDNWDDVEQPIHVEGSLTVPSFAKGDVQRMLMPLEIFEATEVGSFKSEKRTNEIDFAYPYERVDDLLIHVPPGFKAQALPEAQKVSPGPLSYEISATQLPDGLEVKRHLVISGMRYPKKSYLGLRNFFNTAKTDDNAQVLLQATRSVRNN